MKVKGDLEVVGQVSASNLTVTGKLNVGTVDLNTTDTEALVINGDEVQKRILGTNAFTNVVDTELLQKDISWGESYIQNFRSNVIDQGAEYCSNSAGYEFGKLKSQGWVNRPSLVMIPSAVKPGTLFSQLPINNVGDFTVSRNSTATYIDEDGILQTALPNVARIDFSDGTGDGALLLEPQATNLITYPISFGNAYWTKTGASIEGDASTAGSELVVNGDFATDTAWTKEGSWAISAGVATVTGGGANPALIQSPMGTIGSVYLISFEVTANTLVGTGDVFDLPYLIPSASFTIAELTVGVHTFQGTISSANAFRLRLLATATSGSLSIDNVSVKEVQGYSAPSVDFPTSAFKLVEGTSTGNHKIHQNFGGTTANADYSISFYVKPNGNDYVTLNPTGLSASKAQFNLSTKTVAIDNHAGATYSNGKIEELANGWLRCSATVNEPYGTIYAHIYTSPTTSYLSYTGDGTSGVYIFMAQVEQSSVATSPTFTDITLGDEGSTTTRLADSVTDAGDVNTFNDSEGVLYAEVQGFENGGSTRVFSVSDGSDSNNLYVSLSSTSNLIAAQILSGGVAQCNLITTSTNQTNSNKIAVKYKLNDFALWVNGVEVSTDLSGITPSGLDRLNFDFGQGSFDFYGKTKAIQYYNTALSDAELLTLTTL